MCFSADPMFGVLPYTTAHFLMACGFSLALTLAALAAASAFIVRGALAFAWNKTPISDRIAEAIKL